MKKFLAIFISLIMVLSFAACSEKEPANNESTTDNTPVVTDGEINTPLFTVYLHFIISQIPHISSVFLKQIETLQSSRKTVPVSGLVRKSNPKRMLM